MKYKPRKKPNAFMRVEAVRAKWPQITDIQKLCKKAKVKPGAYYASKPKGVTTKSLAIKAAATPEVVSPVHRMETHVYDGPTSTGKSMIMIMDTEDAKLIVQQFMGV